MNKHFPGVRTEHIEMTMPEVAARADVIFSPGTMPGAGFSEVSCSR